MWDTQTTRYGVRYAGNQADVVQQAAKACKKYGIQLALYYSLWDRNCPFYQDDEAYTAYMLRQLEELMEKWSSFGSMAAGISRAHGGGSTKYTIWLSGCSPGARWV